jgi:REP element-mobilizing transposase RayT
MSSTHSALYYHVIFGTKERKPFLAADWEDRLFAYIGGIVRGVDGKLLNAGAAPDHVHLLVSLKPVVSLADTMRDIKRDSSKWIRDTIGVREFAWQEGYGIFSVSRSALESVAEYIGKQREHHRVTPFREEYLNFLNRHKVDYDARYV